MKALKEKRNSLRSLARMGLVILSVFALSFAACRGTGNNIDPTEPTVPTNNTEPTEPPPPARVARSMVLLYQPNRMQFEGMTVDLTGIRVEVIFSDNSREIISDPSQFFTTPYLLETGSTVFTHRSMTNAFADELVPTISLEQLLDPASAGSIDFDADLEGPFYVHLHHVTSATVSAPFVLTAVRPVYRIIEIGGDPFGGESLHITGQLTQRAFFEDDLPNFDGVTVEAVFPEVDFRLQDNAGTLCDGTATGASLDALNLLRGMRSLHGATRRVLDLHQGHVDISHGPYWTGIRGDIAIPGFDGTDRTGEDDTGGVAVEFFGGYAQPSARNTIAFRFNNQRYLLPFDRFHQVVAVEVASITSNLDDWSDHFQFVNTPGGFDWVQEAFGRAGLRLRVFYGGTHETREIGLEEFRRAEGRRWNVLEHNVTPGPAWSPLGGDVDGQGVQLGTMVTVPEMYLRDVEGIVARFGYFSKQRHDLVAHPGDYVTFPNQVIELQIPVWEFDGEIRFQRRADWHPEPNLFVEGTNHPRTGGAAVTHSRIPIGLHDSIRQAYDLVAVYSRAGQERTRAMNSLLWRPYQAAAAEPELVNRFGFGTMALGNTTNEIGELAVTWRFPPITATGAGHNFGVGIAGLDANATGTVDGGGWNLASLVGHAAQPATGHWGNPTSPSTTINAANWNGVAFGNTTIVEGSVAAGNARTRGANAVAAFAGLVAELEPEVLILPWHPGN